MFLFDKKKYLDIIRIIFNFGENMPNCHHLFYKFLIFFLVICAERSYADTINYDSRIAINPNGNRVCVWQSYDTISNLSRIEAAYSVNGTTWSAAQPISQTNLICDNEKLDIDDQGNVVVAWLASDPITGVSEIYAAMYNALSSSWSVYEFIGTSGAVFNLKTNGNGAVILSFEALESGSYVVKVTRATCGTTGWAAPITVSP